ncbi:hypothetical protein DL766_002603 [Monosporascus sp. MC13-8B]|uniref:Anaphase-promoting complex subunit 4 WD40 domain-containing protein n=1 Tax=Monosporascus cannonballus TaxID=155416 RepID=A0ABY0H3V4_9PEZI|nr:hypothetical protein DL763_007869 [Monosporascus cannonballus]RYO83449.1 hypothetical protein DL762_006136 [Monosporascus cannonballus]RYP35260.1 hypothetical protein DL766_002603 [Monosporascus sp. MC13-8B]
MREKLFPRVLRRADKRFPIASLRDESSWRNPPFGQSDKTEVPLDPLITFSMGLLTKAQRSRAGGLMHCHILLSADGSLVAVGLRGDGRVMIISQDAGGGRARKHSEPPTLFPPAVILAKAWQGTQGPQDAQLRVSPNLTRGPPRSGGPLSSQEYPYETDSVKVGYHEQS